MATNEGFVVHDGNPNDQFGGGGCLAVGPLASTDCAGHYINFFRVQTEDHASPYAVICEKHLKDVLAHYGEDEPQPVADSLPMRPATPAHSDLPQFAGVAGIRVGSDDIEV
jgi:hypothetical protein